MSDNAAWCWRNILKLRDKIRDFVGSKIGNDKSSFIWFDKWHSNGPLCKLITRNLFLSKGFEVNDKIVDRIRNNKWTWPSDWSRNFKDVLDVPVPVLNDLEDKTIWFNKKFEDVDFSLRPKTDCLSGFHQTIVYVPCDLLKLFLGNLRLFGSKSRIVDVFLNLSSNTVRLKLLSLNIKWFRDVGIAAKVWYLPYMGLKGDYVFMDNMDFDDMSMIIVIYLSLTWPYFLCLDDGSVWDWYGDGVGFEVKICLRMFIFEHYDFSVLIVGLDSCFVICSLWCFKLFGQICEFLWWLEEYQEVVLHDDLRRQTHFDGIIYALL
ncbi:hypothetical protein Tco_0178242 [Tanacetum coccineum]